ncbi:MAG: succinate dehydrogenase assembly factor 4 [Gammaproteobacteria bacterium]
MDSAPATPPVPELHPAAPPTSLPEIGGPPGPEPTRFGDWERGGRCIDF